MTRTTSFSTVLLLAAAATAWPLTAAQAAPAGSFDCVIEPAVIAHLGSEVPGLIDDVLVHRGDWVKKGEVVARLRSDVEAATVDLMAEQAENDAEVEAQKARLDLAEKKLKRIAELARRSVSSQNDLDQALAEVEVAKREVATAQSQKRSAELQRVKAQKELDQQTIRSPIDGVVTERVLSKGEFLDRNGKVVTIAQLDPLHVEAFLPVSDYDKVHVGMEADVEPNEPIKGEYRGVVKVVDQVFDTASSMFGVRVEIRNPDHRVPAGARCRVSFAGASG